MTGYKLSYHGRIKRMAHDDIYLTSEPGMIPEDMLDKDLWYGVVHVNGCVTVKRYFCWADYKEAGDSDFTKWTTRIFEANGAAEAKKMANTKIIARLG